ncbi:putative sporulation protein YtxC [Serpentinicella sp. ANB-PHB4]|uniref:putative sporulation protein YtxC n=1 Tax=Serpentinicella sp. ANB-PHB4 TaxID=3074076 RepID=UPI002855217F|nr:putative sporulation protein YtxC [Serpentinicella sp. ANB-PHB4]MDR5659580.1 putative sporulation protein YtxC [Serpentinicella sp. ANB-PHB4]
MQLLSIVTDNDVNLLQSIIYNEIKALRNEGVFIDKEINKDKHYYILKYMVDTESIKDYPKEDFNNKFAYYIANALCKFIRAGEEKNVFEDIINYEYNYFTTSEKKDILTRALDLVKNQKKLKELFLEINNECITKELVDYLKTNSQINIKGLITFRLKSYSDSLKEVVDQAVEDFLMDKEYNEFIKLLKYFVDIQEPKLEVVNIYLKSEGKYSLYDHTGKEINNDYLRIIAQEMNEKDVNYDDLLISSLITIAPNEIIIHKTEKNSEEITKTIKRIFMNKVQLCEGCEYCIIKSNVKKE